MHWAGIDVCRATEALKSSTLGVVSTKPAFAKVGHQEGLYDENCEASMCRRWPEWAINTCVAMSKHALRNRTASGDSPAPKVEAETGRNERCGGSRALAADAFSFCVSCLCMFGRADRSVV